MPAMSTGNAVEFATSCNRRTCCIQSKHFSTASDRAPDPRSVGCGCGAQPPRLEPRTHPAARTLKRSDRAEPAEYPERPALRHGGGQGSGARSETRVAGRTAQAVAHAAVIHQRHLHQRASEPELACIAFGGDSVECRIALSTKVERSALICSTSPPQRTVHLGKRVGRACRRVPHGPTAFGDLGLRKASSRTGARFQTTPPNFLGTFPPLHANESRPICDGLPIVQKAGLGLAHRRRARFAPDSVSPEGRVSRSPQHTRLCPDPPRVKLPRRRRARFAPDSVSPRARVSRSPRIPSPCSKSASPPAAAGWPWRRPTS